MTRIFLGIAAAAMMAAPTIAHPVQEQEAANPVDELAVHAIENQNWADAETILRTTLRDDETNAFAMLNLAYVMAKTDRADEAVALYRAVLDLEANPRAEAITGKAKRAKTLAERGIVALADRQP